MGKRLGIVLLGIVLMLGLAGCGKSGPEKVVEQQLKDFKSGKVIDEMIKEEFDDLDDLDDSEAAIIKYMISFLKDNLKKMDYKIKGSSIDGDEATVYVDISYDDASAAIDKAVEKIEDKFYDYDYDDIDEDKVVEELIKEIKKQIKSGGTVRRTISIDIDCEKDGKEWEIYNLNHLQDDLFDAIGSGFDNF